MFQFAQRRKYYFLLSASVIIPGIIAMIISTITYNSPIRLSIDFTGGTIAEFSFIDNVGEQQIRDGLANFGLDDIIVQRLDPISTDEISSDVALEPAGSRWQIRMDNLTDERLNELKAYLQENVSPFWSPQSETEDPLREAAITTSSVSPTVGREVTRAALLATLAVAVIILFFIVWAFRRIPHAFRYGACAIVAMFHDILVTMGVMSILGLLFDWEADALFLTAILTVVGYSVQDSIVVFDRIRENIPKYRGESYDTVVNRSVLETIHRSLATQLNAIFVLIAILLFGGETIQQFIGILLIGMISGTYSSIFNAVPLLISWEKGEIPFVNREAKRRRQEELTVAP
ncbi:MAG TPA: protein translocase subunit SecF [Aggregatilinea sp.]|jgi:preprotein translocase SecF subunit|uniref:protein translocase subunit SecF n=1 Tax=Aggregatilinea sp. TaxID=2806333 RepID=UPI002C970475|nr:protein translocase subunit SecF [Aggregatilinea sp.]HML20194.1 protein translocase subunit SecF [Aggregatilinea sp.]